MTGIVGRTYLERGEPVTVLVQWRQVPEAELLALPGPCAEGDDTAERADPAGGREPDGAAV